eukprot:g11210.t1
MGEGVLTSTYGGTPRIGAKVRRGRDWNKGNEDGGPGREGVLVKEDGRYVWVKWDHDGSLGGYKATRVLVTQSSADVVSVKWDHSGSTYGYSATPDRMRLEYVHTAAEEKAERERKERLRREGVERKRAEKERKERERVEKEERERVEREKADAKWLSLHGRKEIETLRERAAE